AWGGGRASVWSRGDETVVGIGLHDSGQGTESLCDSMLAWEQAAFAEDPSDREAMVVCEGSDVVVAVAPDSETARSMSSGRR
ncbi:MAG: hypothetical protein ACRDWH_03735, partial [Acidimicrobiia bacterium]